ncbi:MAG: hypothetical protein MI922_09360, partial [Bacteroidales bacterium]|nr:hypothetical protein [Bacteroidales bacterium]
RNIFGGFYVNQNMFFNMNSVTVLLGTYIGPYHIYYTYDINLYKNLSFLNGFNSNEVTFLMKIRYKNDKRKRKAIKCPDL